MIKKPELLAPAGNLEKMKMAVLYGADAVYTAIWKNCRIICATCRKLT